MSEQPSTDVPPSSRHRRWLLPGVGLTAVLALLVPLAVLRSAPDGSRPDRPVAEVTPAAVAGTSAVPVAPVPTATPAAAPRPTAKATATARPTHRPVPTRSSRPPTRRPSTATTTARPSCTPAGVVDVVQVFTYGVVKVAARTDGDSTDQLCPGERIRVFWATYRRTADGGATLYRSQVRYLDRAQPTWTMTLSLPGSCGDSWYVVAGNATIPQTLKPGVVPFGGGKLNWETGGDC